MTILMLIRVMIVVKIIVMMIIMTLKLLIEIVRKNKSNQIKTKEKKKATTKFNQKHIPKRKITKKKAKVYTTTTKNKTKIKKPKTKKTKNLARPKWNRGMQKEGLIPKI